MAPVHGYGLHPMTPPFQVVAHIDIHISRWLNMCIYTNTFEDYSEHVHICPIVNSYLIFMSNIE